MRKDWIPCLQGFPFKLRRLWPRIQARKVLGVNFGRVAGHISGGVVLRAFGPVQEAAEDENHNVGWNRQQVA